MRYTIRVDDPALGDLPVSAEHDGVGVAQAPKLDTLYGRGFSPEQRALVDQDELRVFDRHTPRFSFYCTETRWLDGPLGEAAIFRFLHRKAGVSRDAFDAHLQSERCAGHSTRPSPRRRPISRLKRSRSAGSLPSKRPRPRLPRRRQLG
jgi:hypothetical protein